ncbi:hypothetical protein DY000_02055345 [Brassica cretica]|uniref:Uncharacterized protein n=1 Tax=Brassica cretica TaxID=69181 RepID=A0ABQ7AFV7_BRACR|nr:hypothetical protein DY000_02055345 [Brassica cretica]
MSKAYWVAERSIDLGMHGINDLLIERVACIGLCRVLSLLVICNAARDKGDNTALSYGRNRSNVAEARYFT